MNLTNEQKNIITAFTNLKKGELLIVDALAGTSKTFTAIECIKNTPLNKRVLYLAFNSSIAIEMQNKIQKIKIDAIVDICSIHSLAYKNVKFDMQSIISKGAFRKVSAYSFNLFQHTNLNGRNALAVQDLCKRMLEEWCRSPYTRFVDFKQIYRKRGVDSLVIRLVEEYWENVENRNYEALSAFFHDQYLKLYQIENPQLQHDIVIIDEAQDLIPCTQSIIDNFLNQGASVILIGDKYQQINAWIGSINSISFFASKAKFIFPLTQSFRCPANVVAVAQDYLRLLGCDYSFKPCDKQLDNIDKTKTVICRSNAGLIGRIFDSVLDIKKIRLIGKNYDFNELKDLLFLINSLNSGDTKVRKNIKNPVVRTFLSLQDYYDFSKNVDDSEMTQSFRLYEKFGYRKLSEFLNNVENNKFASHGEKAELNLCTTHKSKGLEFENVEIDNSFQNFNDLFENKNSTKAPDEFLKSKYPLAKHWVSREELCIAYVALTRCSRQLIPGILQLSNVNKYIEKIKNNEIIIYDKMIDGSYVSCNGDITTFNIIKNKEEFINSADFEKLQIGKRYTRDALNEFFNFSYKLPSGIKISETGEIVLFTSNTGEKSKFSNDILYFQGQNTGGTVQRLVYGNRALYDAYSASNVRILVFSSYIYEGEYTPYMKPYQENGKWFFPLVKCNSRTISSFNQNTASRKNELKDEFKRYLETKVKQSTAIGYIGKLEVDSQKLALAKSYFIDIFAYDTLNEFMEIYDKIVQDSKFFMVNARSNGGLSAALNNYKKFLTYRDFFKDRN